MFISINNKLFLSRDAVVSFESEALLYGYGVFETIKFKDKKIYFLKEHLERMKEGLKKLNLDFNVDEEDIEKSIYDLIEANKIFSGALKISCIKNKDKQDLILSIKENKYTKEDYKRGFKLCFTDVKRNPHSILTYIKSNNYLENYIVRQKALDKGYDEAVFINIYNEICEGTISNIFFVKNNTLYTPSIECGILPGIMRQKVLSLASKLKVSFEVGQYSKEDLMEADEIFLTNSLMEVMPVSQIDVYKLDLEKNFITRRIMNHFLLDVV